MKKRMSDNVWIPFWVDKWIFGSMRIEFGLEERGVWIDLLALASKDNGYIRANEETPYPIQQLAGMLLIPENILKSAIEKFIKKRKLIRLKNGTLYVTNWGKYQLSDRQKRRYMSRKSDTMSEKSDTMSEKEETKSNQIKTNQIKTKGSEKHSELAVFLERKIKEKLPRYKFQGKRYKENWANTFRIMIEKKEATEDEIKRLITWIFDESDFWYKNILSADKLRKQFGRLWAESGLQREEEEQKKYNEWLKKR